MGLTNSQVLTYNSGAGFTYNSSLIDFSSGTAKLKDITPANATAFADYHADINLVYGVGSLTGTGTNSPGVSGGYLDLTASTIKFVDYIGTGNFSSQQLGCIRFNLIPNYTGTPSGRRTFFAISNATNGFINLITLVHNNSTGNLNVNIIGSNSADIVNANLAVWSPTSGQVYEIELNFDINTGATRLFIDGVQFGSTQTGTGSRSATIASMRIGTNYSATDSSNFKISNLIYFSAVQHTANFASEVPRLAETQYSKADPTIVNNTGTNVTDALLGFSSVLSTPTDSDIKFQILCDGVAKYWNGSAWVASDGSYAQASTTAAILANVASLTVSNCVIKVQAVMHSTYGTATPILTSVEVDYSFFVAEPSKPNTCVVYCWLESIVAAAAVGTSVSAKLEVTNKAAFVNAGHIVGPFNKKSVNFNDSGYAEIELVETATPTKTYDFDITYTDGTLTQTIKMASVIVPNQASAALTSLVTL